jgi:hypothetical protein
MRKNFESNSLDEKVLQDTEKLELSNKLEKICGFRIIEYVIDEIYNEKTYKEVCIMIGVASINEKMSKDESKKLKEKIKEIFKIEKNEDRINLEYLNSVNVL